MSRVYTECILYVTGRKGQTWRAPPNRGAFVLLSQSKLLLPEWVYSDLHQQFSGLNWTLGLPLSHIQATVSASGPFLPIHIIDRKWLAAQCGLFAWLTQQQCDMSNFWETSSLCQGRDLFSPTAALSDQDQSRLEESIEAAVWTPL